MAGTFVRRWVSGGQTGVDRAVLDAAIARGEPYGGWCPAGGWAEDRPEPPGLLADYPALRPTPSSDPAQRTTWNVRDSDATLILGQRRETASPGTELTLEVARTLGRPVLVLDGLLDGLFDAADPAVRGRVVAGEALSGVDEALSGVDELLAWLAGLAGATTEVLLSGARGAPDGSNGLILNVAGPRESEAPGAYVRARLLLEEAIRRLRASH